MNECNEDLKTIIIEPDDESNIFNNEMKLYKALKRSLLGEVGIVGVTKNITRKIIIVKLKNTPINKMEEIIGIKQIGEWKVNCRLPLNQSKSVGVIGPIGVDTNLEEFQTDLKEVYPDILKVERIFEVRAG